MTRTEILRARMARLDRIAESLNTELEQVRASELWFRCMIELDDIELAEAFRMQEENQELWLGNANQATEPIKSNGFTS